MANFRNKQWFKNMSDEEKQRLCKEFNTTLQGLKRAGYVGEDGHLKIDLLRIEVPFPSEEWKHHLENVDSEEFKKLHKELMGLENDHLEEILEVLEEMYSIWNPGVKFYKPDLKKSNINLWITQTKLFINNNIIALEEERSAEDSDRDQMICIARKAYLHLSCLFESELNNIKK